MTLEMASPGAESKSEDRYADDFIPTGTSGEACRLDGYYKQLRATAFQPGSM